MLNLFKKKKKKITIKSPINGMTVKLEEVPDEVFSQKALGEGIAIKPTSDVIVSPIKGKVAMIMEESKHAIAITSKDGFQILIHIGLDTVNLRGEGFTVLTSVDSEVEVGTPLIKFDENILKLKNISSITMLVITESAGYNITSIFENLDSVSGDTTIIECEEE